jgi:hypothetical protein
MKRSASAAKAAKAAPAKRGAAAPTAARRARTRRPSGLARLIALHVSRIVAAVIRAQRQLIADEIAVLMT